MARSLTELLPACNAGKFPRISQVLLKEKIMPTLFQCPVRTLLSQSINDCWGREGPREETAYAILALASLLAVPSAHFFRSEICTCNWQRSTFSNEVENF